MPKAPSIVNPLQPEVVPFVSNNCVHKWHLSAPEGMRSFGECTRCHATRWFEEPAGKDMWSHTDFEAGCLCIICGERKPREAFASLPRNRSKGTCRECESLSKVPAPVGEGASPPEIGPMDCVVPSEISAPQATALAINFGNLPNQDSDEGSFSAPDDRKAYVDTLLELVRQNPEDRLLDRLERVIGLVK